MTLTEIYEFAIEKGFNVDPRGREALEQIEAGNYGICVDCGVDIAVARLDTQPAAVRCIDCQEMFEIEGAVGTPRL